jgi:tetratricopeptide (TPR) repeat protein
LLLSGNSRTNLTKLVDKCSDLLQFNKNSSFVDDALLILGKAFYYQANYQKSKRKFEELLSTDPSEEIKLEAELWIAKCEMQMRNFTTGINSLRAVGATAIVKEYNTIVEESFIEEIKYFKSLEDYNTTIDLLNRFIKYIDDDELLALVYLELGNLYTIQKNYSKAVESFLLAIENTSDFDTEIKATLNYASSLRLNNQIEESLQFLRNIRGKDKFVESLAQIELEIGKANVELGRYDDALESFIKVDSTYKNSPFAALAVYEIGKLFENNLGNFDSAAFYYNRAQLSNPPKEFQTEIIEKNSLFSSYVRLRKSIDNYDRQLFYALNPEIYRQDSIAYVQDSLQILQEYLEKKELSDIWSSINEANEKKISINYLNLRDSVFVQDSVKLSDSLSKAFVQLEPDSVIKLLLTKALFRDSIRVADSLKTEGTFLEPEELNILLTERRNKLLPPKVSNNTITDFASKIPVDSINFKKNPPTLPTISMDELKNLIAKNRLELGNLFFTEIEIPDSAYKLYKEIVEKFDSTRYYPDALFALGSFYLTVNQKPKADSIFTKIYNEYKELSIANSAADKLGLPLIDFTFDPGKELFLKAENYIKNQDYKSGIKSFIEITNNFPQSKFADKGLYAAGFILENDLRLLDSAVTIYDTLISKYPSSDFVRMVAMKVTVYKQEKARIKKEMEEAQNKVVVVEEEKINPAFQGQIETEITPIEVEEKFTEEEPVFEKKELITQVPKKKLERLWNPRKHRR